MMLKLATATALLAATALGNACTVSDGTNTFDLSTVPVARGLKIPSDILGTDWTVSLCNKAKPTAPRTCADDASAFVYNFGTSNTCSASLPGAVGPWKWNAGSKSATRSFEGGSEKIGLGVIVHVTLVCDPTATTLRHDGGSSARDEGNLLVMAFSLKTRAICSAIPPAPPAPTATPAPAGPPGPAPAPGPYGFHYCGAVAPAKLAVRAQTSKPIAVIDGVGSQLTCPCLTVASNSSLMASFVKLSVACGASPQGPFAMVKELAQNTGYTTADPVAARCPVRGYFAIVAWNPNSHNAALDYGAKCTVSN